jgi:hypothetical protein
MTEHMSARGRSAWTSIRFALGAVATLLAVSVGSFAGSLGWVVERPRYLDAGYAVVALIVAAYGLLHWDRPRLGSAAAIVAAGLTLGIAAAGGASDGIGLLFLPGGVLMALGANDLWKRARQTPPGPGQAS